MSNLKILHGAQHGPQPTETEGSPPSHAGGDPEHLGARPQTSYSHDKTPARQREFESQGIQNRSLFEATSKQHGNHPHGSKSNDQHSGAPPLGKVVLNLPEENRAERVQPLSNRNNGRSFDAAGRPVAQSKSYGSEAPLVGKAILNIREADGSERSEPQSNRNNGRSFYGVGQPDARAESYASEGPPARRGLLNNQAANESGRGEPQSNRNNGRPLDRGGQPDVRPESYDSEGPSGLRGSLNLREGNGRGRGEPLNNHANTRFSDGDGPPDVSTKSHGHKGDDGRGYISRDSRTDFDGWDNQTNGPSRSYKHDGLLRTSRDTVNTELSELRFPESDARRVPPGQAKRLENSIASRQHGWENRQDNDPGLRGTLKDVFRSANEQFRPVAHRQDIDPGPRSTLKEAFRTANEQFRTIAHDWSKTSPGSDPWPDYANRLAYKIDYALENRLQRGGVYERGVREIASEVVTIGQLGKYFSRLEQTGGEPVRQAYRVVMDFLMGSRVGEYDRLRFAAELLRDLRSGVFLFKEDLDAPFPLTGRARVVSEMIELMRTLDAIEAFSEAMRSNGLKADWPLLQLGGLSGPELMAILDQLLTETGPMFPSLVGRLEIARLVAQLDGVLNNAEGKPLLMIDGKPLRVGDLLWLNLLTNNASLGVDRLGIKLSAPFMCGLDSVFSLIGFDGRSLSVPHFLAIQSQINAFNFDWVSGQAPLSEGWMRMAIESLKDSRVFNHNVLGEMLEEALTNGRLHLLVMRGTVETGKPVSDSCIFSPVYDLNGKVVAATS